MGKNFQFSIFNSQKSAGLTIFEVMMAIALVAVAATIVVLSFSKMNEKKALDASASVVISVLDEARNLTLSGAEASQYGVHLEDSQVTLFRGATYSASQPDNRVTPLHSLAALRNINLAGGGVDIVFQRLTGTTAQTGSMEVYLMASPTESKTISINANGIAEEN